MWTGLVIEESAPGEVFLGPVVAETKEDVIEKLNQLAFLNVYDECDSLEDFIDKHMRKYNYTHSKSEELVDKDCQPGDSKIHINNVDELMTYFIKEYNPVKMYRSDQYCSVFIKQAKDVKVGKLVEIGHKRHRNE